MSESLTKPQGMTPEIDPHILKLMQASVVNGYGLGCADSQLLLDVLEATQQQLDEAEGELATYHLAEIPRVRYSDEKWQRKNQELAEQLATALREREQAQQAKQDLSQWVLGLLGVDTSEWPRDSNVDAAMTLAVKYFIIKAVTLERDLSNAMAAVKAYMFIEQTNSGRNPHPMGTNKHIAFELGRIALATPDKPQEKLKIAMPDASTDLNNEGGTEA